MVEAAYRLGTFGAGMAAIYFIAEHHKSGGSMLEPMGLAILCLSVMLVLTRVWR